MTRVALERLNSGTAADFSAVLGNVFEHAPWIAERAAGQRPFATMAALFTALRDVVRAAPASQTLDLIRNHPDLAGKAALTRESTTEQASAGLDRLSEADFARFQSLNGTYHAKFEHPFIICVRRHTVASILSEFERRLALGPDAEHATAIEEVLRIGALRLDTLVEAPDRLPVVGRLTTHVLDTHNGKPASGVEVALYELSATGQMREIVHTVTNADGRTDPPLLAGQPIPIGCYELHFDIGRYFTARGASAGGFAFLGTVPIRFGVAEPESHYHVPLLASPWSYTTYRGS